MRLGNEAREWGLGMRLGSEARGMRPGNEARK